MKNYVQPGDTITVAAPYALLSGQGCLVGTLFGIAAFDAAQNANVEIQLVGIFDHAKAASQAWTVGALIYWDNTNLVFTTTASGNTLVGKAVAAVGSGANETTGRVRLSGT